MFPYNNPFGDWTEGSNVQTPSVYGALPYPSGTISSDFVTFQFFNFQPDIFNCTVIGPQTQIYYQVITDAQNPGYTVIKDGKGKNLALVEWQAHPFVELRGTLPKQPVGNWLKLPPAKHSRTMDIKGVTYTWAPQDQSINLYSGSGLSIMCLAKIFRGQGTITLEITPHALQLGILDSVVVAVLLLQSGRNID